MPARRCACRSESSRMIPRLSPRAQLPTYHQGMHVVWRRWSRILGLIVLLGLVCGVPAVRHAMLRTLGWALVVDEPVGPADIIVVPVWAGVAGAIDAADMVHSNVAGRVAVLAEPPKPAERELTRRGASYHDEK